MVDDEVLFDLKWKRHAKVRGRKDGAKKERRGKEKEQQITRHQPDSLFSRLACDLILVGCDIRMLTTARVVVDTLRLNMLPAR